jgi:hypothetical protein
MYIDNLTGIEFTFYTESQYENARFGGYIDNYKIARIEVTYDDGSRFGYYISIYRDERGLYERPIHYKRG